MSIFSALNQQELSPQRYIVACLLALAVFLIVLVLVAFVPLVSYWDATVSEWLQQFRHAAVDRIMLLITISADGFVTSVIIVAIVLFLGLRERWWLAFHLGCVYLSAKLGVSIIKELVSRARPEMVEGSLAYYSFPSGHATSATVLAGLTAILLAYQHTLAVRNTIYVMAALFALLIGLSRVYLLAHWPSDIIAGLAIGFCLAVTFAWQLHSGPFLDTRRLAAVVIGAFVSAMAVQCFLTFNEQLTRYAISG